MTIHKEENGTYPAYTDLGGYPLFYICQDGGTLCPTCANAHRDLDSGTDDPQWHVIGQEVNWEDAELSCDHCNTRIVSAYAEPEGE